MSGFRLTLDDGRVFHLPCDLTLKEAVEWVSEMDLARAKRKRLEERLGNNIDPSIDPVIQLGDDGTAEISALIVGG